MQYLTLVTVRLATLLRCRRSDRGASLVEYALLVALIAVVCISAVAFLGSSNAGSINESSSTVGSALD